MLNLKEFNVIKQEQNDQFPNLKTAYWLKEGIRNVYKASDKQEALERYENWVEVDGYEMKTIVSLDPEEVKGLFRFLKQNQFY